MIPLLEYAPMLAQSPASGKAQYLKSALLDLCTPQ